MPKKTTSKPVSARLRLACQMGVYCPEHNFIHGAEAEELRKKIEALIAEAMERGSNIGHWELQRLLDETDARDAIAYLEICKKHERDDEAWGRERGALRMNPVTSGKKKAQKKP